jgi:hypothetical protein
MGQKWMRMRFSLRSNENWESGRETPIPRALIYDSFSVCDQALISPKKLEAANNFWTHEPKVNVFHFEIQGLAAVHQKYPL